MAEAYLVDAPEKEGTAIQLLLKLLPGITGDFFHALGVNPSFAWYVVRTERDRLIPSMKGDVDIAAGPLQWRDPEELRVLASERNRWDTDMAAPLRQRLAPLRLAEDGGIAWPPTLSRLVSVEVKCAYLSPDAEAVSASALKSKKASWQKTRRLRLQVNGLLQMGFDRAVLLDAIANPPASGTGFEAWLQAGGTAAESLKAMLPVLGDRLPAGNPAGHWVWSIGAVEGGDESKRGAGAPMPLSTGCENPYLQKDATVKMHRKAMEGRFVELFERIPPPHALRVYLVYCRRCRRLHEFDKSCDNS